ncbi:MAG TPA: DNA polymerase III subunit gamma/tau [Lachnospiraceae bacterium]|nr:DNA polymerase III subunit gamma/tau [Lachnospiraceae bacterium]
MSYTALYRKFRPTEFSDVKGQDHIVTTLKNQIRADRIGHAYLFCGTRGTGKTTIAKIFARAVNCQEPKDGSPCGVCACCRAIASGASMNVIEIDAASNNGVDNIREIRDEVAYSPTEGKYKVYIIDEVHMLSGGAFNALLKTLEEPPSYVIFILATTEVHRIPVTILSRCQRYDFRRITVETITFRLKELMEEEQVEVEERALSYIAKAADGSMRDALSLLDQCIAFYLGETLTYEHVLEVIGAVDLDVFGSFFRKICAQDLSSVIRELENIVLQGKELSQFILDFIWYLRNLLMLKSGPGMEDEIDVSAERLAQMKEDGNLADMDTLMRYIRIFSELSGQLRYATQKRVLVEIALIKLCRPSMEQNYDSILQRLAQLEQKLEQGVVVSAVPSGSNTAAIPLSAEAPKEKIVPEALPKDVQTLIERFQEVRKKTGGWAQNVLKGAQLRELPGHTGVQIVLNKNHPVDEEALAEELEQVIEKELHVRMAVQICTPATDTRAEEASIDLSGMIHMDIDIE